MCQNHTTAPTFTFPFQGYGDRARVATKALFYIISLRLHFSPVAGMSNSSTPHFAKDTLLSLSKVSTRGVKRNTIQQHLRLQPTCITASDFRRGRTFRDPL